MHHTKNDKTSDIPILQVKFIFIIHIILNKLTKSFVTLMHYNNQNQNLFYNRSPNIEVIQHYKNGSLFA